MPGDALPPLLGWRCGVCTRLTLSWQPDPPPKACSWPTCRATALAPFPLRPPRRKD